VNHDEVGICVPSVNRAGDPCQDARIRSDVGPDGDRIVAANPEPCEATLTPGASAPVCTANTFGFVGGVCSEECSQNGWFGGPYVCIATPLSGFETECAEQPVPIGQCAQEHSVRRLLRACSWDSPCREDYGCARVEGAPPAIGACMPPYFLFQTRIDPPGSHLRAIDL
jgi:hypothetical protein